MHWVSLQETGKNQFFARTDFLQEESISCKTEKDERRAEMQWVGLQENRQESIFANKKHQKNGKDAVGRFASKHARCHFLRE